jgi:tetratricopeptide (TPR) repeat protein
LTNAKRWDEARAEYFTALNLNKKLVERLPALGMPEIELGGTYCNYGILILREGKASESLEWFDRAVQILEPIHKKKPNDAAAKLNLRNSFWSRAQAYDRLHKRVEALKDWDQTIALSLPAEQIPMRAARAILRLQEGLVAEAVEDANEVTKSENWTAEQWYNLACVYSVASAKLADKKPGHADRAMELLRTAVKTGFKNAAALKHDGDLDPIRDREDFKKLVNELEAQSTVAPAAPAAHQHNAP